MGWYIDKGVCPNCSSNDFETWLRPGECKLGACTKCGFFVSSRSTFMVESSFIEKSLIGKKDLGWSEDLYFENEQERNQNIIEKGSEF